jgi:hypothetical protein
MRYMSFALTEQQMHDRIKTVTRRLGWLKLKVGDQVQPARKCMGLRRGESIELIGSPIEIVGVRREPLRLLTDMLGYGYEEIEKEGFAEHPTYRFPSEFVAMFCASHRGCTPNSVVTRIEFRYC